MSMNQSYHQSSVKSYLSPNRKLTKKSTKKRKKETNWMLLGFGLSAIAVFSATGGALLAFSLSKLSFNSVKLTAEQKAVFNQEETVTYSSLKVPELSRPINILILGTKVLTTDLGKQDEELGYQALVNSFEGLSDTMLLLRFDPAENKLSVLSIPRDTKTYVKGYGETKINEANHYGGAALAAETVSDLLRGVPIDRYVRINVQGVEKLIDALGGVNFYVPQDMKYTDHSQHFYVDLKEGQQHLNGEKTLQFLRFRHDGYGDIGRIQRNQLLMRKLIEQTLSPKAIMKIPDILGIIHSHIDTNLTTSELMALGTFAGKKNSSEVELLMLPGNFNQPEKDELSYWLPNRHKIKNMVQANFKGDYFLSENDYMTHKEINPATLNVAIQDSTDNPEAVQAMVNYLKELGYGIVYTSHKSYTKPLKKTQIIAQNGDSYSASNILVNLGLGEVLVESTGVLNSDITIQVGQDWIQDQYIKEKYPDHEYKTTSY